MILTSIIIVNYNSSNLTIQTLESIKNQVQNPEKYEIIVVDNASENEEFIILKDYVAAFNNGFSVKLFRSRLNVGFGAGNMCGINLARGDYYVFLNNDVILLEDSIEKLIDYLEQNKDVSIVGCQAIDENKVKYKAFDYDLSLITEIIGDSFLTILNKKKYPPRYIVTDKPMEVGAVPGSLFACNATDFDAVGGFDSSLFLYYEEKDLAYRIKKRLNKKVVSLPYTSYIHLKGKSTVKSQLIRNEMKISQFYTIHKNLGTFTYLVFYIIHFILFTLKFPFNKKYRSYLKLLLQGISPSHSIKHLQQIKNY